MRFGLEINSNYAHKYRIKKNNTLGESIWKQTEVNTKICGKKMRNSTNLSRRLNRISELSLTLSQSKKRTMNNSEAWFTAKIKKFPRTNHIK